MDAQLKQRVVGAAVLVALGVIFIPLMLDNGGESGPAVDLDIGSPAPAGFNSRVIPIDDATMDRVERAMDASSDDLAAQSPAIGEPPAAEADEPVVEPESEVVPDPDPVPAAVAQSPSEPPLADVAPRAPAPAAAPKTESSETEAPLRTGVSAWVVQLGSFTTQANADGLVQRLKEAGYTTFIELLDDNGKVTYRVRVGPELTKITAERLRDEIQKKIELKGIVMRYP